MEPIGDGEYEVLSAPPAPREVPADVPPESAFWRESEKMDTIRKLREQAAKAGPDDPFALSEEAIEALSKRETLILQ